MAPVSDNVGDVCAFLYPDDPGVSHRFFSDFPYGRRVPAAEAYVDRHEARNVAKYVEVLQVRRRTFDGVEYVGVEFEARNGMRLWTTFSDDDDEWLKVVYRVSQPEIHLE